MVVKAYYLGVFVAIIYVVILLSNYVYAKEIECALNTVTVASVETIIVKCSLIDESSYLKIRPIVSKGLSEIMNLSNIWVSGRSDWSQLPTIDKNINIRIKQSGSYENLLHFIFLNTKTGSTATSSDIRIYSRDRVNGDLEDINNSISAPISEVYTNLNSDIVDTSETSVSEEDSANVTLPQYVVPMLYICIIFSLGVLYFTLKKPDLP